MCDMSDSYVRHVSFARAPDAQLLLVSQRVLVVSKRLLLVLKRVHRDSFHRDMTHLYVTRLIHTRNIIFICDMTHFFLRRISCSAYPKMRTRSTLEIHGHMPKVTIIKTTSKMSTSGGQCRQNLFFMYLSHAHTEDKNTHTHATTYTNVNMYMHIHKYICMQVFVFSVARTCSLYPCHMASTYSHTCTYTHTNRNSNTHTHVCTYRKYKDIGI